MKVYLKRIGPDLKMDESITNDIKDIKINDSTKLFDVLMEEFPNGFEVETDVYVNKEKISVENFDMRVSPGDLITVSETPAWSYFIMFVVSIVISLILSFLLKPKEPENGVASSIYTTSANQITTKLGDAIPVQYGSLRRFPALVANNYRFYRGNEEYHMINTCLGVGDFDIEEVYINDSKIDDMSLSDGSEVKKDVVMGKINELSLAVDPAGTVMNTVYSGAAGEYLTLAIDMPSGIFNMLDQSGVITQLTVVPEFKVIFYSASETKIVNISGTGNHSIQGITADPWTVKIFRVDNSIPEMKKLENKANYVYPETVQYQTTCRSGGFDLLSGIYTFSDEINLKIVNFPNNPECFRHIAPASVGHSITEVGTNYSAISSTFKVVQTEIDLYFTLNTRYTETIDSVVTVKDQTVDLDVIFVRVDAVQDVIVKSFSYSNSIGTETKHELIDNIPYGNYDITVVRKDLLVHSYAGLDISYDYKFVAVKGDVTLKHSESTFATSSIAKMFQYDAIDKADFLKDLQKSFSVNSFVQDSTIGFIAHTPTELENLDLEMIDRKGFHFEHPDKSVNSWTNSPALVSKINYVAMGGDISKLTYDPYDPFPESGYVYASVRNNPLYGAPSATTWDTTHDVKPILVMDVEGLPPGETPEVVINANNTNVSTVLINYRLPSGLYAIDDEKPSTGDIISSNLGLSDDSNYGSDIDAYFEMKIYLYEIDENDNKTGFNKVVTESFTKNTRKEIANTINISVKYGRYKIKIVRSDSSSKTKVAKCSLTSVVGLENKASLEHARNYTMLSFLVKSGGGISSTSGFKINVQATRRKDGRSHYKTLRDFVEDVWTNDLYGMNESLDSIDIRAELDEPVSILLDKSEQAFDVLSSTLKSFGYVIYPYLTKFVIKKEEAQPFRKLIFSSKNCSNISFGYSVKSVIDSKTGVKCRYLPETELNFETVYFPQDLTRYDETVLVGINDKDSAEDMAEYLYRKKTLQLGTCSITTDLEGLIPEIGVRVGVASEYVDRTFAAEGDEIVNNILTLKQDVKLLANKQYYVVIETQSNNSSALMPIEQVLVDTVTNELDLINGTFDTEDDVFQVIIGDRIEVVRDFVITNISALEMSSDMSSPSTISIDMQKYNEEVYGNAFSSKTKYQ